MFDALRSLVVRVLRVPPDPPEVPAGTHESARVFRASPRFFDYLVLQWAIGMAILAIVILGSTAAGAVALAAAGHAWIGLALMVAAALVVAAKACVLYVTTRLDYEMRWYVVTDRSLRIREGVFVVREVTLTFANVQNITLSQGPLQRYFGISDLVVQTAGGGASGAGAGAEGMGAAHHGVLTGIDDAPAVKETIQALLRAYRAAGLGDPDEPAAGPARAGTAADLSLEALRAVREETARLRAVVATRQG